MIQITDFIHCYENMLDKNICQEIIKNSENLKFQRASTLNNVTDYRKCYSEKLDEKFDNDVFKAVGNVIAQYAKDHIHFSTGLSVEDTGYDHLIYIGAQKGEYKEHTDHGDINPRVLTCSFILNDDYDGGDFVFFGGRYKVTKKTGSAIVFPSNFCFPHAVTPVSNGDRHAVITWIH
jgi:predicted 2-oxoglutarate/Fe(II)-dependent dioxygenase YbiX